MMDFRASARGYASQHDPRGAGPPRAAGAPPEPTGRLLTDRSAYMQYLEDQVARVNDACLAVTAQDGRLSEVEKRLVVVQRLVKTSQSFSEEHDTGFRRAWGSLDKRVKALEVFSGLEEPEFDGEEPSLFALSLQKGQKVKSQLAQEMRLLDERFRLMSDDVDKRIAAQAVEIEERVGWEYEAKYAGLQAKVQGEVAALMQEVAGFRDGAAAELKGVRGWLEQGNAKFASLEEWVDYLKQEAARAGEARAQAATQEALVALEQRVGEAEPLLHAHADGLADLRLDLEALEQGHQKRMTKTETELEVAVAALEKAQGKSDALHADRVAQLQQGVEALDRSHGERLAAVEAELTKLSAGTNERLNELVLEVKNVSEERKKAIMSLTKLRQELVKDKLGGPEDKDVLTLAKVAPKATSSAAKPGAPKKKSVAATAASKRAGAGPAAKAEVPAEESNLEVVRMVADLQLQQQALQLQLAEMERRQERVTEKVADVETKELQEIKTDIEEMKKEITPEPPGSPDQPMPEANGGPGQLGVTLTTPGGTTTDLEERIMASVSHVQDLSETILSLKHELQESHQTTARLFGVVDGLSSGLTQTQTLTAPFSADKAARNGLPDQGAAAGTAATPYTSMYAQATPMNNLFAAEPEAAESEALKDLYRKIGRIEEQIGDGPDSESDAAQSSEAGDDEESDDGEEGPAEEPPEKPKKKAAAKKKAVGKKATKTTATKKAPAAKTATKKGTAKAKPAAKKVAAKKKKASKK